MKTINHLAVAVAVLLVFALIGCDEREHLPINSIRFAEPQPAGVPILRKIPTEWHGTYKVLAMPSGRDALFPHYDYNDSSRIRISAKGIARESYKKDKVSKYEMDSTMRDSLKRLPKSDAERIQFAKKRYWKVFGISAAKFHTLRIERDSLYYEVTLTDTLPTSSFTPYRLLDDAMLINYTMHADRWRFLYLTHNANGDLLVSTLADSVLLARAPAVGVALTPIGCHPGDPIPPDTARNVSRCFSLKPNVAQLRELLSGDGLQLIARYTRTKK